MRLRVVAEYSDAGWLLWAADCPGAYARGRTREEAEAKLAPDVARYLAWLGEAGAPGEIQIVQFKKSSLCVEDADSDVIFDGELKPLAREEYEALKALAMRSARDFQLLYDSMPDKTRAAKPPRATFFGDVPRTPEQMYLHTMGVNSYYFGEIGVDAPVGPDIAACRAEGFSRLERTADFLENRRFDGSFDEMWTLRKVCRRFVWHDRIHARAMWRVSRALYGDGASADPYLFGK